MSEHNSRHPFDDSQDGERKSNRERKSNGQLSATGERLWLAWFVLLAVLVYTPWVAPYGQHEPFVLGLPFTLFWWMLLSLLLVASLIVFAAFCWPGDDHKDSKP